METALLTRYRSTDTNGSHFSEEIKKAVWNKAKEAEGYDPNIIRKDYCGALMQWDKYGDTEMFGLGWEIDHIKPVALGGNDDLSNLQPLQWQNNRNKANKYPTSDYCEMP